MAGTTRLELATSAVTVSGLQVLSTTWKSTDGTASHWKYIIGNVIVYSDVYRADFCQPCRFGALLPGGPSSSSIRHSEGSRTVTALPRNIGGFREDCQAGEFSAAMH